MNDWTDYADFWGLQDSITTVVEANGHVVWDIRQIGTNIRLELNDHISEDVVMDLCRQLPLAADYDGNGEHGAVFTLYINN